jgi:hypothetical protein
MIVDTRKTAEVEPSLNNRKPYRTKAGKLRARAKAVKNQLGYWNSTEPVLYHPARDDLKGNSGKSQKAKTF